MSSILQSMRNGCDNAYVFAVTQYEKFHTVSSEIYQQQVASKDTYGLPEPVTRRQFVTDIFCNIKPLILANVKAVAFGLLTFCTVGRKADWKASFIKNLDKSVTLNVCNMIDVVGVITPGRVNAWLAIKK